MVYQKARLRDGTPLNILVRTLTSLTIIIKFYYLKRSLNKKTAELSGFLITQNIFLHCCLEKKNWSLYLCGQLQLPDNAKPCEYGVKYKMWTLTGTNFPLICFSLWPRCTRWCTPWHSMKMNLSVCTREVQQLQHWNSNNWTWNSTNDLFFPDKLIIDLSTQLSRKYTTIC